MAIVPAPTHRGGTVPLETSIQLVPTEYYFIAQGRHSTDTSYYHHRVNNINMDKLFSVLEFLSIWEPDDGRNSFFIGTGQVGLASNLIGKQVDRVTGTKPDIGFVSVYAITHEPTSSPTPTVSPSTLPKRIQVTQLPVQRPRR